MDKGTLNSAGGIAEGLSADGHITVQPGHPTPASSSTATSSFKPIGPRDYINSKKKYKFVEPPGIIDWVIAFAKKSALVVFVYSLGYYQVSTGWLVGPIILMVLREQWRRSHDAQREIAKAAAKGDEREIILARLGESLPSWVTFPDVERAEWLNQIIDQLWPRINNYTYDLVVSVIEPALRETLATSYKMGSFRFEKIILGDMPLRVRGVKVYDSKRTDRDEIIMDLDVIYAGDCDFRFSMAKITAGIKDLQISGTLRLIMKPLINEIPLIGGVQYFFLNPPTLDFNLIGLADLFDMPGLSDLIRRIVQEQISAMVVLPNKMFIQLSDSVNARDTCAAEPQGVIRVCAIEAKNLLKKDVGVLGTGKSDPYVVLSVGAQQFKSKVINNSVNPKWDFWCEAMLCTLEQKLLVEVWDYDPGFPGAQNDDFLGKGTVDLNLVRREGTIDLWLELEDVKKGQIHLKLTWLGFSSNPAVLKEAMEFGQNYGLATSLLTVRVDSAKSLPHVKEGSKPDPYAILSVGKKQQETVTLEKTDSPVFEETFHFLVSNPLTDTLVLKMMDRKTSGELGTLKQSLDHVIARPHMTLEKQNLELNIRSEARVTLDMRLRILQVRKKGDWVEEEEAETEKAEPDDTNAAETTPLLNPQSEASVEPSSIHNEAIEEKHVQDVGAAAPVKVVEGNMGGGDASNEMKIRLTIRYSAQTQTLVVVVITVNGLPIHNDELPDPYVKMYVLPEKSKKHKTETQKDQTDPVYDERFDFPLIDLRGKTLHVQVCDKKFMRKSPNIGQVFIPLDDYHTGNAITNWYPITP